MEAVDFQSGTLIPLPPPLLQEGCFDALLTYGKVAESLAGAAWVRSRADGFPGFSPLGMYYRFEGANFQQWVGAAVSSSRGVALPEFDRLHSAASPGQLNSTYRSDLHPALHLGTSSSNVNCATPVKRRGKSMSRRTGQAGHTEKSGKWWVVRWWMDVEGQDKRVHKRARICPVSGPGVLSKSERTRRAREIIAESGADTVEHFNAVVVKKQETITTFQQQGARWLTSLRTRKRKPVAPGTTEDWERILSNWLNPHLGALPLSEVNNASLKRLVAAMSVAGLSPKTIDNYALLVKMVVASAVDAEGEEIFPRKWNHEFIDMPIVEKSKQNTPCFSGDVMTGLAGWKKPRERMLFILCGGAGLRIGEALGIEIDKHIASDFSLLKIRQKARHCKIEERLKTQSALRDVDLHPAIAKLLKEYVGERQSGFLFSTRNGKPIASSNVIRRHLHPALEKLKYVNPYTGNHKAGNHAFRRFRNTYLRNHTECPEGLYKYWMGHAGESMSDLYDKIKEDVVFRKKWA